MKWDRQNACSKFLLEKGGKNNTWREMYDGVRSLQESSHKDGFLSGFAFGIVLMLAVAVLIYYGGVV